MAKLRFINSFSKVNNDTGFGTNANYGGRFINRDGSFNIKKVGQTFWERFSLFQIMLSLPTWKFIVVSISFFIVVNVIYTCLYLMAGIEQFEGIIAHTRWEEIKEIYFFSSETFTTVGYGRVNPIGDQANFIASIEAMSGFATFAIFTGIIYGRFAKPKAYLTFSDHALIGPYKDGYGLMFRFASYKDNHILTDVEIKVTAALQVQENDKATYKFFTLDLERNKVDSLSMNWTVVHPIDEKSPLAGLSQEDIKNSDLEVYVLIRGYNDVFSNFVLQRTSYTYHEILFNRKFVPMYKESASTTILELHKLNDHVDVH
jgi:inward rectifier potassium channel